MGYYAGIDLGGTHIKFALLDENRALVQQAKADTPFAERPERVFEVMNIEVEGLLRRQGIEADALRGIGIGVPGPTDFRAGVARSVPFLRWVNTDVATPLREHFGAPVFVENDGNVNALGEKAFGAAKPYDNFILLTLGTGLGGTAMVEGRLLRGAGYVAFEVGHMVIEEGGEPCVCGNRGCFEACCSASGMLRYARRYALEDANTLLLQYAGGDLFAIRPEMIDKGFDAGDPACKRVFHTFNHKLATGILNLINLFNPDAVIIAGGVAGAGERILGPTRKLVEEGLMHPIQRCDIITGTLKGQAGMLGAAAMAADEVQG